MFNLIDRTKSGFPTCSETKSRAFSLPACYFAHYSYRNQKELGADETITYDFADGKKEIEVSDEIEELYENILKYEKKVNRKETRRHVSLNVMIDAGFDFPDLTSDIETALEREEEEKREHEMAEQEEHYLEQERLCLESRLTPRQSEAYFMFYYLK